MSFDWINAIDRHPLTIPTDTAVAAVLAEEPDRLWSLHDVLHRMHHDHDLGDLRDSVRSLVGLGFLESVAEVECEEHLDGY